MNSSVVRALAGFAGLALLAGCTADDMELYSTTPSNFGEATKQTFAAQVIDPDPEYTFLVPTTSGDHAADAIDRYRNDTVKQPETQDVSEVLSSGGGS